jgi:hypothetical protein
MSSLTVGSNILEYTFGDELSNITDSPKLSVLPDPDIEKDAISENYRLINKPDIQYRMINIQKIYICDCCCNSRYIINIESYYCIKISDGLFKICADCINKIELILIKNIQFYATYTEEIKFYQNGSNIDKSSLTLIVPAIIGSNIRYIPVDHNVINDMLKRYNRIPETRGMTKKELIDHIYTNTPCISCKMIKNENIRIQIYNTLNYVCGDCNNSCRKEKVKINDFSFSFSLSHIDVFIDYDKPNMYCRTHTNNFIWIYTKIILANKTYDIIPVCSYCYLSMIKNPKRIF